VHADARFANRLLLPGFTLDDTALQASVRALSKHRPVLIEGATETLSVLAEHIVQQGGITFHPKALLCYGQELTPSARKTIESAFACPAFSLYNSGEFADVACETETHDGLLVAAEGYVVELLVDGRPARPGEEGELLITDLNNRCMPFIRYATGDRAVAMGADASFPNARGLPRIGAVNGRQGGTISGPGGARVPFGFFSALFAQYGYAVRRFRVLPRSPELLELVIEKAARYSESTLEELKSKIAERLGSAKIDVFFEDAENGPNSAVPPVARITEAGQREPTARGLG